MKKIITVLLISLLFISCSPATVVIEGVLIRQIQDEQIKQNQELRDLQKRQEQLEKRINDISVPVDP